MSVISVYRTFYWTKGRLAGYTGYVWQTKEEQARCIRDALGPPPLMSGVAVNPITDIPVTKGQEQRDARDHIKCQSCLCGIHGYFSPNYLDLMTITAGKAGFTFPLESEGTVVYTRVRLGGLVDIHSMGARGEYGLIEEAWCDDDDVGRAVAERYDIPVNRSEFEKEPRTDPLIDNNTKVVKLSPMFSGLNEAVAMGGFSNTIPGSAVGIKAFHIPKPGLAMLPPSQKLAASLFGQPLTFQQYMSLVGGSQQLPPSPFGAPSGRPLVPGSFVSPCQCGICAKVRARSPHTPLCPALLGGNCQCGAGPGTVGPPSVWNAKYSTPHARNPALHRGALGLPKCIICGTSENNHTVSRCRAALPKIVLVAPTIKPGIITRLKRILGRAK